MKTFNLFVIILALTTAVACGDKKKSKSDNGLPVYNQFQQGQAVPVTQVGTMNMQSGVITVGSQSFSPQQIAQQGSQYANQIFSQLQQNPFMVPPISQNPNVYRIRVTGYAMQGGGYQMQGGYQQYPQQQISGLQLVITAPIQPY